MKGMTSRNHEVRADKTDETMYKERRTGTMRYKGNKGKVAGVAQRTLVKRNLPLRLYFFIIAQVGSYSSISHPAPIPGYKE